MNTTSVTTTPASELPAALAGTGFTAEAVAALEGFAGDGSWLAARRAAAWQRFESLPMPTNRDEHWRFTKLRGFSLDKMATYSVAGSHADPDADAALDLATRTLEASSIETGEHAARIVTVNDAQRCRMNDGLDSLPEGVVFCKLRHAMRDHQELWAKYAGTAVTSEGSTSPNDKFVALAEAMADNGVLLYVPRNVRIEQPLLAPVVHTADGATINRHVVVVLEEGAEATFVEDFVSADASHGGFANMVVELVVGANARLNYITKQDWAQGMTHFATHRLLAHRDAQVEWTAVGLGASRGKSRMEVRMVGAGSSVHLNGVYFLDGKQNLDFDTKQFHEAPNAMSDLAFRGVQAGHATSVWRGMIDVVRDAQGTDSYQENRNLLLSATTHADSIPGLQIEANEVRCTHGATTSKLDMEQLFYLQARGLSKAEATRQIARGFYFPVLDRISNEQLRDGVRDALFARLDDTLQG